MFFFVFVIYYGAITMEFQFVGHNGNSVMLRKKMMTNVRESVVTVIGDLKIDSGPKDQQALVCYQNEKATYSKGNGNKFCGDDSGVSLIGQFDRVGVELQKDTCVGIDVDNNKSWYNSYKKFQQNLNIEDYDKSPIRLKYSYYNTLPQGLQDNGGGYINGHIISIGGFCGGNNAFGYAYCCGIRGFLGGGWSLKLDSTNKQCWKNLAAPFPGKPRQGVNCASVENTNSLYCWGGFSYTPLKVSAAKDKIKTKKSNAYGFVDGYKLTVSNDDKFKWTKLPDLPTSQGSFSQMIACQNGDEKHIFVFGGSDYDSNQFHTNWDRNKENKGLAGFLWQYNIPSSDGDDTRPQHEAWTRLPNLPGTPRFIHLAMCVKDTIYVIGGATEGTSFGDTNTFKSVIDNWKFSLTTKTWTRLADTPAMFGNSRAPSKVYKDRYIFLVGGYGYKSAVVNNIVKTQEELKYTGMPYLNNDVNIWAYSNGVMVYDILKDQFFWTDPLPIGNNYPLVSIVGDELYVIGGETGGGCLLGKPVGRHSDIVFKAEIQMRDGKE